mmetsp:Transcript_80778/g.249204  ORF Transcript_80778/g.249204 Transcript_80778/m.249204 type:complete len:246 (+) Transcript_80778:53-790(+)
MAPKELGADKGAGAEGLPQPPPAGASKQDLLAWKRECNILRREADWKRRQDDLLRRKKAAWQIENLERENRLQAAREARRGEELESRLCRKQLELGEQQKGELRSDAIAKRAETWDSQESSRLLAISQGAKEEAAAREAERAARKAQAWEEMRSTAQQRSSEQAREAERSRLREERIQEREERRRVKAAEEARRLKSDPAAKLRTVLRVVVDSALPHGVEAVSDLVPRPIDPQYSHFGAGDRDIL